jgi:RNase H-fold protein (predicted Holliday junction resolvase)
VPSVTDRTILAIDPGSSKHGIALVRRQQPGQIDVLWRSISGRAELKLRVEEAQKIRPFSLIVLGDGTRSREVSDQLRTYFPSINQLLVDEKNTSIRAREKYWVHNPKKGWRVLLPSTLLSPPVPIDDYAAVVLAERFFNSG